MFRFCIIAIVSLSSIHLGGSSVTQKLYESEQGFLKRWEEFGGDKMDFALWHPDWKEEELATRFGQMTADRKTLYFGDPEGWFDKRKVSQNPETFHLVPDGSTPSRYAPSSTSCGSAFAYNLASPDYDASIIHLHGNCFLAMESPNKETLAGFFQVLKDYNVTHLVRLTPAYEVKRDRIASLPYWEGRTDIHPQTGRPTIKIDDREIHYIPMDCWENHEGLNPDRLLALVKTAMCDEPDMIAVHCRAGIGRTGTFIAACTLIQDIDHQLADGIKPEDIKVSIDKVIWELSLQRALSVPHFSQYLTLHQLVDYYLKQQS